MLSLVLLKRYFLYFFHPVRNLSNKMVSSWVVRMWAAAVIITKGLSTAWAWETTCSAVLSSCHPHQLTINMEGCTHALRGSLTGFLESGTTTQQGSGNWVMWGIRNPQSSFAPPNDSFLHSLVFKEGYMKFNNFKNNNKKNLKLEFV